MRQENNKWQKRADRGGFGVPNEYDHYVVSKPAPLLEWLLENVKSSSKTKIKQILQGRGIRVEGKTITKFDYPLRPGMKIAVSKSKKNQETFKSKYLKIVYEDRYLVVVEKQIGILSMAAGHSSLNVKTVLDDYFHKTRQNCQAHVVHRLDRDTSGLMIYAKDKQTELALEDDWHHNVYDRRYVALVSGEMEEDEGTVANWLKDNKAYITYSSDTDNGGKYAVTHYHTLQRSTDYSLVEFKLETGRKNQIRVHTADMGHPVCGDIKYGNGDDPKTIGAVALPHGGDGDGEEAQILRFEEGGEFGRKTEGKRLRQTLQGETYGGRRHVPPARRQGEALFRDSRFAFRARNAARIDHFGGFGQRCGDDRLQVGLSAARGFHAQRPFGPTAYGQLREHHRRDGGFPRAG